MGIVFKSELDAVFMLEQSLMQFSKNQDPEGYAYMSQAYEPSLKSDTLKDTAYIF